MWVGVHKLSHIAVKKVKGTGFEKGRISLSEIQFSFSGSPLSSGI